MIWGLLACSSPAPAPQAAPAPVAVPKPPPVVVHRYVSASTLNLREAARSDAKVLRRLPINTPLKVEGVDGDFAEVRTPQGEHGYVGAAYLDAEQLTRDGAMAKLDAAESAEERLSWAQRAAALAPVDPDVLDRLAEAYGAVGKTAEQEAVKARRLELGGDRYQRCFASEQRAQLEAYGRELEAVADVAGFVAALDHGATLASTVSESLGQLFDYETDKVCGETGIEWLDPLLPGMEPHWGPEGLGVYAVVSLSELAPVAKKTPAPEDDAFLVAIATVYENVEGTGWAAFEEREWDYGGCSSFGRTTVHRDALKASDPLVGGVFDARIQQLRKRVIHDIVTDDDEFFPFCTSMANPTPSDQLVAELDAILAEVKLSEEERAQLTERKQKGFPLNAG